MESPRRTAIERLAYQLWLERGCPIGTPLDDWNRAERLLNFSRKDGEPPVAMESPVAIEPVLPVRASRKKPLPKAAPVDIPPPHPQTEQARMPRKAQKK